MRARFAAALGSPMPTKQTVPFLSLRAAAIVMISAGVYPASDMSDLHFRFDAATVRGKIFCAQNVPVHPCAELLPVPGDIVPGLAKRIVSFVIPVCVGGMRAARHHADA